MIQDRLDGQVVQIEQMGVNVDRLDHGLRLRSAGAAPLCCETWVKAVRLAEQRRPSQGAGGELEADLALLGGDLGGALRRVVEIVAGREREDLRLAGSL